MEISTLPQPPEFVKTLQRNEAKELNVPGKKFVLLHYCEERKLFVKQWIL